MGAVEGGGWREGGGREGEGAGRSDEGGCFETRDEVWGEGLLQENETGNGSGSKGALSVCEEGDWESSQRKVDCGIRQNRSVLT